MTDELIDAFDGKDVDYSFADSNIQVLSAVNNQENGEVEAVVIGISSMDDITEMLYYLYTQRATLIGLFFLITLIVTIFSGHVHATPFPEHAKRTGYHCGRSSGGESAGDRIPGVFRMSTSFNRIINRYKELENSRQEFVSNVSHELKTPITSMKILADSLLTQENVPAEIYADFMNDIVHEIDRENQIINDLLTLVKMDKTRADLNIAPTNINEMLEVLLKRISPIAEKRNITIRLETMRQVTAEVDEVKLSLACNNIIENAVKYNHDGGKVDVSLNGDHKFFYIRVKDTGVGIPEDCQEQIFERFYRVDKARSRETGGTGLGLAISRNVILLHKGSIRVHSKEGEGATFIIRIPLNYLG